MLELMIPLDGNSRKPLYEQIYIYIRTHIADGKISCGEKLPSTRFLSAHLQVSRTTVELAYGQLLSEGYIEAKPCRGYYACDISGLCQNGPLSKISMEKPQAKRKTGDTGCRIVFSPDANEPGAFPFATWRRIYREVLAENDKTLLTAGEAAGEWELREALCRYLYHARGVNCRPEQMVVGAGNEYLLLLLAQIIGPGKTVAMENPTYWKAYRTLANAGYTVAGLSADSGGIRMEEIRRLMPDIIYTMPSHHFPTGRVMPMKRRLELLQWAGEKTGRFLIEDDYDSEFRYRGKPVPSLQGSDRNGTVIYLGTFSRSISPAVRVSFMALPDTLLESYYVNCGFYASTVPKEQQKALAAFLSGGYFERYLNKMRRIYKEKHDLFLALLKKEAWVSHIYGDHAGTHLLAELNTKQAVWQLVKKVKAQGVRVFDLEEYRILGAGSPKLQKGRPALLLGYGALTEEEMKEGIACIRKAMDGKEKEIEYGET